MAKFAVAGIVQVETIDKVYENTLELYDIIDVLKR